MRVSCPGWPSRGAARRPGGRGRRPRLAGPAAPAAAGAVLASSPSHRTAVICRKLGSWVGVSHLFHQSLVCEDRLELVTGDGDDEHTEEDRLHDEENTVQDPGLPQVNVL